MGNDQSQGGASAIKGDDVARLSRPTQRELRDASRPAPAADVSDSIAFGRFWPWAMCLRCFRWSAYVSCVVGTCHRLH